jgi:hypothetical protein
VDAQLLGQRLSHAILPSLVLGQITHYNTLLTL